MPGLLKKLEIFGRNLLFRIIAPGVSATDALPSLPDGVIIDRVLIMRQDRIGDMIMTLPLLRRLREIHPDLSIAVVASESNSVILKYEKDISVITYDKSPGKFLSSLLAARDFMPDVVVDMHMHDSTTSFIYAALSGAKWKLHIDRENRLPFNIRVEVSQDGHIMDAFSGLLSGLGRKVETEELKREISLSDTETDFARCFWSGLDVAPEDCIAINISSGGENRWWGMDRYREVCRGIISLGMKPLLLYAPEHKERASTIAMQEAEILISPLTPTVLHVAALLRDVRLLVSPDTSVVHIAASSGIPVVGMYLPFDPSLPKWYPWQVSSRILMSEDHRSLESISPESVIRGVQEILEIGRGIK
ncbi:MAG: glycosyltransferase family 9 protein [Candidatus Aegiribacteria sp.]|nr:glycosyltransferase family 9 protein [Candidatus Aegiribacteria sp.]